MKFKSIKSIKSIKKNIKNIKNKKKKTIKNIKGGGPFFSKHNKTKLHEEENKVKFDARNKLQIFIDNLHNNVTYFDIKFICLFIVRYNLIDDVTLIYEFINSLCIHHHNYIASICEMNKLNTKNSNIDLIKDKEHITDKFHSIYNLIYKDTYTPQTLINKRNKITLHYNKLLLDFDNNNNNNNIKESKKKQEFVKQIINEPKDKKIERVINECYKSSSNTYNEYDSLNKYLKNNVNIYNFLNKKSLDKNSINEIYKTLFLKNGFFIDIDYETYEPKINTLIN